MTYADAFLAFLDHHTSVQPRSTHSAAYMGTSHRYLGLTAQQMKAFVAAWMKSTGKSLDADTVLQTLDTVMQTDIHEARALVGYVLGKHHALRQTIPLHTLHAWLRACEGWQQVDAICQSNFTAADMLPRWQEWQPFLQRLRTDQNVHCRRAALVLLLTPLRKSNDERFVTLAFAQIDTLQHDRDTLITKAVSWVLRTAIKHHRDAVAVYVEQHTDSLPAIAVRETRKKLQTGTK